jgi:carboxylesterase 2
MAGTASCDFALHHNAVDACRQFVAGFGVHDADSYQVLFLRRYFFYIFQLIEKLRHTEAKKFAVALKIDLEPVNDISTEIGPRLDGHFFPKPLSELRKEAPKKKRLVGTCEYEGLILS